MREHFVDAVLQGGHVRTVLGDVLQVCLAASADLVHVLDFGLHGGHDRLAARDAFDLFVDMVGELFQLGDAPLEGDDFLLGKHELAAPLLELLEHGFHALQLIVRRFDVRHGVSLACLNARELAQQLFLDGGRARQLFRHALHLPLALRHFGRHVARRFEETREPLLLLAEHRFVPLDALEAREGLVDFRPQHGELGGHRQKLVLKRVHAVEFLLRV